LLADLCGNNILPTSLSMASLLLQFHILGSMRKCRWSLSQCHSG
jgi:hypothetical protein